MYTKSWVALDINWKHGLALYEPIKETSWNFLLVRLSNKAGMRKKIAGKTKEFTLNFFKKYCRSLKKHELVLES